LAFLPEAARFERLRCEAQGLQARYPDTGTHPPLYGTLIGVKDMLHVAGFATLAGSQLPAQVLGGPEAECVRILKLAGGLILGKTRTSEFAYVAPTLTRNPHHAGHTPGGSSSGSAAAVAAGLCRLALGTQTTGSLLRPAAFCGVVGVKPSYDRISRPGVIPLAPSLDHVGFFTPDVASAAQAARLLCSHWRERVSYRHQPVLGIPQGPYLARASQEGSAHFEAVCRHLARQGYEVHIVPAMSDFDEIVVRHGLLLAGEAARTHARWFPIYEPRYHPETAELIRRGQRVDPVALERARKGRGKLRAELMALMGAFDVDVWISPAAPGAAPKGLSSTGDAIMNLPWTHAGLPTLSLPAGKNAEGLPLGLQVTARWYADEGLLAWCMDLEEALTDFNFGT
jgi:Asp-tRNA(Asn)/Glu-tRNA(Gln) amidotransferase A subunit family amidase